MNRRYVIFAVIIVLLFLVVSARIPMLLYGFPFDLGAEDENGFIGAALNYGASKSLKPMTYWLPALYPYILTIAFGVYYLFSVAFHYVAGVTDFAVTYLIYPGYFNFIGRLISILFSSATVILLYFSGKIYKGALAGGIAALLYVCSVTIVRRTGWALPESAILFLTTVSIFYSVKYLNLPKLKYICLAGIFCGLAIAIKYNVGTLMLVGLSAIFFSHVQQDKNHMIWAIGKRFLLSKPVYCYVLGTIFAFALTNPYWIIDPLTQLSGLAWEIGRLQSERSGTSALLSQVPFIWIFSEFIMVETGSGLIIVLSVAYLFYKSAKADISAWLFLPFVLVSAFLIGRYNKHSLHYFIPVFPVLFIVAGKMVEEFTDRYRAKSALILLLCGGLACFSLYHVFTYSYHFQAKDTRLLARQWILENVPYGSTIAVGRTQNGPPLPDINRFDKANYSMISEQVLSQKLPARIKLRYKERIDGKSYNLINYIVKQSQGRKSSYDDMMQDFNILTGQDLANEDVVYIIYSSSDKSYLEKNNYASLADVPGIKERYTLIKSFEPQYDTSRGPVIEIYKLKS